MGVPGEVLDPDIVRLEDVLLDSAGVQVPALLARPVQDGPRPGLVVLHEAFGPTDHIHDVAARFANAGFDSLAPDLYSRIGKPDPSDLASVSAAMRSLTDAELLSDLEAAGSFLRSLPGSSGRLGAIGFCAGGRVALQWAFDSDALDAVVDCWGGLLERRPDGSADPSRLSPVLDRHVNLSCPALLVGGAEDANPSPENLELLTARMEAAGKDVTLRIFDGAGHAFFADYRDTYREGPAHELWPLLLSFLHDHLSEG